MRLIDADILIAKLKEKYDFNKVNETALLIALDIKNAPTVKLTPKNEWETDEEGNWHCSVCGATIKRYEQGWHHYRYCYHCGAKMEEE